MFQIEKNNFKAYFFLCSFLDVLKTYMKIIELLVDNGILTNR